MMAFAVSGLAEPNGKFVGFEPRKNQRILSGRTINMNFHHRFPTLIAASIALASGLAHAETYEFRHQVNGLTAELAESAPADAIDLTCGYYHCYALVNGTVWSVGLNYDGQLGLGDTDDRSSWTQLTDPFAVPEN
jgi:hypothetical protein